MSARARPPPTASVSQRVRSADNGSSAGRGIRDARPGALDLAMAAGVRVAALLERGERAVARAVAAGVGSSV